MERLSLSVFESLNTQFDALVATSPGVVDVFCSSTPWILSAYEAFSPNYTPWLARSDAGMVALVESTHESIGRFRQPMEASWCLANAFAGAQPQKLALDFVQASLREASDWDLLFLSGLECDSMLFRELAAGFSARYFVGLGVPVRRFRASLSGGFDGFLSRRSSKFRANSRRIMRRAIEAGFTFEYFRHFEGASCWETMYEEILKVEARSWKGKAGTGLLDEPMQHFYRLMFPRLVAQGALRVMFILRGGERVGSIFGGVNGQMYRGLQMSFDQDLGAHSLGNLAQLGMIGFLCDEGLGWYDLGSELEYKGRWAEHRVETQPLIIRHW